MSVIRGLALVEVRRYLADPSSWFFLLVLPLLLIAVLGSQSEASNPRSVGVASATTGSTGSTEDRATAAALLADLSGQLESAGLRASPYRDEAALRDAVGSGEVDAGVLLRGTEPLALTTVVPGDLPPGLGRLVDAALGELESQQRAVTAGTDAGLSSADATRALRTRPADWESAGVQVDDRDIRLELSALDRFDRGAAGQLVLFVFLNILVGATATIQARRSGVLRRLRTAPVTPAHLVAGLALGRFLIGAGQALYIVAGATVLFGVQWGDPLVVGAVVVLFSALSAGAAILLGVLASTETSANGIAVGASLVLGALGGCMIPLELFPDDLVALAQLAPHSWAYRALSTAQSGGSLGDVTVELTVLGVIAAALLGLASLALVRTVARAV